VKAIDYFCAFVVSLAVGLYSCPALAQTLTEWPWDWSDQPNPAKTQAIDAPPVEHLFGDWGGLQTKLLAHGVNLQVNAVSELAGNVTGGTRQGATFANQVGIDLDINWERLAGIVGFSTSGGLDCLDRGCRWLSGFSAGYVSPFLALHAGKA
jgi:carbohydrate-selective porin OprB